MSDQILQLTVDTHGARVNLDSLGQSLDRAAAATNAFKSAVGGGLGAADRAFGKLAGSAGKFAEAGRALNTVKIDPRLPNQVLAFAKAMDSIATAKTISKSKVDNLRGFAKALATVSVPPGLAAAIPFLNSLGSIKVPSSAQITRLKELFTVLKGASAATGVGAAGSKNIAALGNALASLNNINPPSAAKIARITQLFHALASLHAIPGAAAIAHDLNLIGSSAQRASNGFSGLPPRILATGHAAQRSSGGIIHLGNSLNGLSARFSLAYQSGTLFGTMFSAFTLGTFVRNIYETNVQLLRLSNSMFFATGTFKGAEEAMGSFNAMSMKMGLDMKTAADPFSRFIISAKTSGMEFAQAKKVFESVSGALTVVGATTQQTELAFYGLTQMIMKGKVSSEEFNRQIGEQIPGNATIGAKALSMMRGKKVTEAEFFKAMKDGAIESIPFVKAYAKAMRDQFGPLLEQALKRPDVALRRLGNAFTIFKQEVGGAGFMTAITLALNDLTAKMVVFDKDGVAHLTAGAEKLAKEIGTSLGNAVQAAGRALGYLADHMNEVVTAGKALVALNLGGSVMRIGGMIGGAKGLGGIAEKSGKFLAPVGGVLGSTVKVAGRGVASAATTGLAAAGAGIAYGPKAGLSMLVPKLPVLPKMALSFASVGAAVKGAGGAVAGAGRLMMTALGGLLPVLGVVTGAFAALVVGMMVFSDKSVEVQGRTVKVGDILSATLKVGGDRLKEMFASGSGGMGAVGKFMEKLGKNAGEILINLTAGFITFAEVVVRLFVGIGTVITDLLLRPLGQVVRAMIAIGHGDIGTAFKAVGSGIKDAVSGIGLAVKDTFSAVRGLGDVSFNRNKEAVTKAVMASADQRLMDQNARASTDASKKAAEAALAQKDAAAAQEKAADDLQRAARNLMDEPLTFEKEFARAKALTDGTFYNSVKKTAAFSDDDTPKKPQDVAQAQLDAAKQTTASAANLTGSASNLTGSAGSLTGSAGKLDSAADKLADASMNLYDKLAMSSMPQQTGSLPTIFTQPGAEKEFKIPASLQAKFAELTKKYNLDPAYAAAVAKRESSFDPNARNPTAAGLFGFTGETWKNLMMGGRDPGVIAAEAQLNSVQKSKAHNSADVETAQDRVTEARRKAGARSYSLDDRYNVDLQFDAFARLTGENFKSLKSAQDVKPTAGQLYGAHFAGPAPFNRLSKALVDTPNARAADVMYQDAGRRADVVKNNPLFKQGTATVKEVYENLIGTLKESFTPPPETKSAAKQAATEAVTPAVTGLGESEEASLVKTREKLNNMSTDMMKDLSPADAIDGTLQDWLLTFHKLNDGMEAIATMAKQRGVAFEGYSQKFLESAQLRYDKFKQDRIDAKNPVGKEIRLGQEQLRQQAMINSGLSDQAEFRAKIVGFEEDFNLEARDAALALKDQFMVLKEQERLLKARSSLRDISEQYSVSRMAPEKRQDYQYRMQSLEDVGATGATLAEREAQLTPERDAIAKQIAEYHRMMEHPPGFQKWVQGLQPVADRLEDIKANFAESLSDAITGALVGDKVDWKALVKDVQRQIVKVGVDQMLAGVLGKFGVNKPMDPAVQAAMMAADKQTAAATDFQAVTTRWDQVGAKWDAVADKIAGGGAPQQAASGVEGQPTATTIPTYDLGDIGKGLGATLAQSLGITNIDSLVPQVGMNLTPAEPITPLSIAAAPVNANPEGFTPTAAMTAGLPQIDPATGAGGGGFMGMLSGLLSSLKSGFMALISPILGFFHQGARDPVQALTAPMQAAYQGAKDPAQIQIATAKEAAMAHETAAKTVSQVQTQSAKELAGSANGLTTSATNLSAAATHLQQVTGGGGGAAGAGGGAGGLSNILQSGLDPLTSAVTSIDRANVQTNVPGLTPTPTLSLGGAAENPFASAASWAGGPADANLLSGVTVGGFNGGGSGTNLAPFEAMMSGGGGISAMPVNANPDGFMSTASMLAGLPAIDPATGAGAAAGGGMSGGNMAMMAVALIPSILSLFKKKKKKAAETEQTVNGVIGESRAINTTGRQVAGHSNVIGDLLNVAVSLGMQGISGSGGGSFTAGLGKMFAGFSEGGYATSPVTFATNMTAAHWAGAPHYKEGTTNTHGIPAVLHPNEAVIPLSRGRKIPVEMAGGGGGGVTIHAPMTIITPDASSFRSSQGAIERKQSSSLRRTAVRNLSH